MICGIYQARMATTPDDVAAALHLRSLCFRGGLGDRADQDRFDALCRHVVITDLRSGQVVGCCRLMSFADGGDLGASYSAQFYDLGPFADRPGPLLELGRFCLHPDHSDPDLLRATWGLLTQTVDAEGVRHMFGCSSFAGADPAAHAPALGYLAQAHLGVRQPGVLAPDRVDLRPLPAGTAATLPALLRSYLTMGAWVSDHAVIDRDLNTLHVFTWLAVDAVPQARARALRALGRNLANSTG